MADTACDWSYTPASHSARSYPEFAYDLLDSGPTDWLRAARRRGSERPPGQQADVSCLSMAAEPVAAISVLGADLSQATVTA